MELLNTKLYSFQKQGVEFASQHHYSLLGYQQGLGKTIMAIYSALLNSKRTVIVCPAFLAKNWDREIYKFAAYPVKTKICKYKHDIPEDFDFIICSYEAFKKINSSLSGIDLIIFDEIHYLKNLSAQRTQAAHAFIKRDRCSRMIGLSGTPIKNGVPEFYSLLLLCSYNPHNTSGIDVRQNYKTQFKFNMAFCNRVTKRIGNREITSFEGMRNADKLRALLKDKYIRKRVDECLDLPDINYTEFHIDKLTNDSALLEAWTGYGKGKNKKAIMSAKSVAAVAKVNSTIEYACNLLSGTSQLVIFSDHVASAKAISIGLSNKKFKVICISGEMLADKRAKYVQDFQDRKLNVIVATIGALKEGVTLTAANHLIFNDLSWVSADNSQAAARVYRISQTKPVFIHHILAGHIDNLIYRTLKKKMKVIKQLL